ncbi:MAG TPA: PHB depolymerase family esterase [Patescibacteria group bacterium]|nr:PHB depolymerase family esterase [Patescibacteria group bacterium]
MISAIDELLAPLLITLERMMWAQRHLHPQLAGQLADQLEPPAEGIAAPLQALEDATWPENLVFMRERLLDVGHRTLDMVKGFVEAARTSADPLDLYRAVRRFARVQETLYPLAPAFDPVSRWFLDPALRGNDDLVARLRVGALRDDGVEVGVLHADNEREARGGFSLYVPEAWDGQASMPLVVALHGGSGHGRDFLWSWLREARGRNVLVLSPTAQDRTWSIMGGADVDADRLRETIESVATRYPVDRARVLLTGMSDGATYALLLGLRSGPPFTHLAPACGVLHPLLFAGGLDRAQDFPIYLIHGALDWMFPVYTARMGRDALLSAGARLVYREIEDLSHTYPRDENPRILEWLVSD